MTPEQQRARKKGTNQGEDSTPDQPLTTAIRTLLSMTMAVCTSTIGLYAWFGRGDEVQCGSGISSKICYLPGPDWLGYAVLLSFALVVISFMFLSPKK